MNTPRRPATTARASLAALSALAISAAASAAPRLQDVAAPPQPDRNQSLISPVGGYAIMALFFAVIVMISLIPSKRGAQD
jgi:hypothetical protein